MERKWWTLVVVCVAVFMLLLDITVVNVALPDIQRDLGADFSDTQWVIDAYALMLATLLLTAGSAGDRLGRRKVFAVGLVLFMAASLLCGLAPDPTFLILARGAQGIGGAIMFALSLALIAQEFEGKERGTALGIWGATTGAAVAVGPLVGGLLVETLGWEWIFFVNVPVGAFGLWVTLTKVAESKDPNAGGVDIPGVLTFSGALFALVYALVRGNEEGWGSALIVSLFSATALLLLAFVIIELRSRSPMFELSLFRKPAFVGSSLAAFSLSASMFAMFLYLTLYVQNVLGYSPLEAGLIFLPITVLSFFAAAISGRLTAVIGARVLLGSGLLLIGVGLILMGGIDVRDDWDTLLVGFLLSGVGIGLTNPALASSAIGVVPPQRAGMASGINSTFRQVGIATGIAALGAVFESQVSAVLPDALDKAEQAIAILGPKAVPAAAQAVATEAFVDGLNHILVIAAIVALSGAVLAALLVRPKDFVQPAQPPAEQPTD